MQYPVLCTPIGQGTPALTLFCASTQPRPVYVCLHLILLTSCSTYMSLHMHFIHMPLPLGSLPKPHSYDRAPIPSCVPLHVPRPVYLYSHPPCESRFQPFQCISTPPCHAYSSPRSSLCISNLAPAPPCVHLTPSCQVYTHTHDHYFLCISVNTPFVYVCPHPDLCTSTFLTLCTSAPTRPVYLCPRLEPSCVLLSSSCPVYP